MGRGKNYPVEWKPYVPPAGLALNVRGVEDLTTRELERIIEWVLRSPGEEKEKRDA